MAGCEWMHPHASAAALPGAACASVTENSPRVGYTLLSLKPDGLNNASHCACDNNNCTHHPDELISGGLTSGEPQQACCELGGS